VEEKGQKGRRGDEGNIKTGGGWQLIKLQEFICKTVNDFSNENCKSDCGDRLMGCNCRGMDGLSENCRTFRKSFCKGFCKV